jgi:outer membrane protein OmpA-like peptidoglycan-associated protein
LACFLSVPLTLAAQVVSPVKASSAGDSASKWDIFVGYGFYSPNATVDGYSETRKQTPGPILPVSFYPEKFGLVESLTRFFTPHLGLEFSSGQHDLFVYDAIYDSKGVNHGASNSGLFTMQTGPFYRWRDGRWTPWVHGLVGGAVMEGPNSQSYTPGETFTLGGGIDYELSHHWALRTEADYEYVHVNYGSPYLASDHMDWFAGGVVNANGPRFAGGIVYHIYPGSHPPPALDCSQSPASVFPGEPVTVTATASNLNHRLNAAYFWSGPGVTGSGTTATVDTAKLAPGTYTVNGQVREGKTGKEGLKPGETADCSTSFTVRRFEPPTVSCYAAPGTIQPGAPSTITAAGVSPQNRPLTYSYLSASGAISGNDATAEFDSAGAPSGPVAIVCTVTDDGGQTATSETSVTIAPPYVPPVSHTEALCSLSFGKDKMRPTRVDNEAKACLDEIALGLQKQPDSTVVVVGSEDARESARTAREESLARRNRHVKVQDFAAERAVNAKEYLVREKGIDAARISVATNSSSGQRAQDYLVPAGASFSSDVAGATPVNETAVKPQARKPLGMRHPHRKHPHKAHRSKKHIAPMESAPETKSVKPPQ